jgi:hypothetical protein
VTDDWRRARIATNEARFRDINERLGQGLRRVRHAPEPQQFVCECGNRTCEALVSLTFDEYEAVRRDSRRFAVSPGHGIPEAERVVAGNDRYDVVEKIGDAVELTDATDRRAPGARGLRSDDPTP